ncbi:MAG: hypothetical protein JST54_28915 [Deltaproteobacteria bacterium]|nr:hypothetical protein [Deltaproteobacteria bacterium]
MRIPQIAVAALGLFVVVTAARAADRSVGEAKAAEAVAEVKRKIAAKVIECPDKKCLTAKETACVPSHARLEHGTLEGQFVAEDWFVHRGADGKCSATLVLDLTRDSYGKCRVLVRDCASVAAASSDSWDTMGCVQHEFWRNPVCKR